MIKRYTATIILFICLTTVAFETKKEVTIFLAGDSTMQTYKEEETPMRGWGQYFQELFCSDVRVVNKAIGGRSTKSFIAEGRWQSLLEEVEKGDWVFVQFGHNDGSNKPERYTSPEDYERNLILFVEEVREKKANPVLLTSISMRRFDSTGHVVNGLGVYPDLTRLVARKLRVPLIDLNAATSKYIADLGEEASKQSFMWLEPGEHPKYPDGLQDNTHLREPGAREVARLAAEGIMQLKLKPLTNCLKK
ncbi:rhamnogalacturonan acetylesterase [Cesiribacter sp. SM1]|uniref:rhamnogalacturonan acetylesterase n=1 Tax=Cesiribacter sp. SM1 TaxID=2861196 RepID=UPI001CD5A7EA|nr:rhamnogalacturonan acetylesterase [Cesiribacter sp. SM1]